MHRFWGTGHHIQGPAHVRTSDTAIRTLVAAALLMQSAWGLFVLPQPAVAAPATITWTEQADFERNACTTGEETARVQVDTVTSPGDVKLSPRAISVASGAYQVIGLRDDGTVIVMAGPWTGDYWETLLWTDIVAATGGFDHTVGLKSDGTVVSTPMGADPDVDLSGWTDITAIAAGNSLTVGLKSDGTVLHAGPAQGAAVDTSTWSGITAIAAGWKHVLGLRSNGTVVATGDNSSGQLATGTWTGIVAVAAGAYHSVGLRADGTVVAVGDNTGGQCEVGGWTDVAMVVAAWDHTIGVREDGTVLTAGLAGPWLDDLAGWSDVVEISTGYLHAVGVTSNGTILIAGESWMTDGVLDAFTSPAMIGAIGPGPGLPGLRADFGAGGTLGSLVADIDALATGEAVKFGVRLSDDGTTWTDVLGSDGGPIDWTSGSGTYLGQAYGDAVSRTDLSQLPSARYIDIVVLLEGASGTSPVLHSVTLSYETGEAETYTVTFESNGGSAVPPQTVASGGLVTEPADPTRDHHTFAGWYADAGLTDAWDFATDTVTADMTLYAKWTIDTYPVTFLDWDDTVLSEQQVPWGGSAVAPPDPVREGYTFTGWDTDFTNVTGPLVVRALYDPNPPTYTVTFESNGGSAVPPQTVASGGLVTEPADPTRDHHTFAGWYADAGLTDAWDFATDTVTADMTLYAKWVIDTCPVTFLDWDDTVLSEQQIPWGGSAVAPPEPVRDGYTFTGWDTDFTNVTGPLVVRALYARLPVTFIRHDGADRYETAMLAAIRDFPDGADIAIVATGERFPDALAASGLAGVTDAPILLTRVKTLSPACDYALRVLGVKKVYILGDTKAVSGGIETELRKRYEVMRLGGPDRYYTARDIADEAMRLGASRTDVFLALGSNFPDALAMSSIATQEHITVLLTRAAELHPEAAAVISGARVQKVYIAGDTKAVSAATAGQVAALGASVIRWGGVNRYDTAARIIEGATARWDIEVNEIGLATGANWPDALTGGAAMGRQDGLLLLTTPDVLSPYTEPIIVKHKATIRKVEFYGSTKSLSQTVENRVRYLLQ